MRELSIWLDAHCSRADRGVFRTAAELREATTADRVESVSDGLELLECIQGQPKHSIGHVVIAGHGGTTWLLDDQYGVTTGKPRHGDQIAIHELAEALAEVLVPSTPLISLAACLCSRSPTWFLKRRFGRHIGSDWGARAYLPGGQASLAARLRDFLWWHRVSARVRGHRAAGHATALALLAEHYGLPGTACDTLFQRALPRQYPDMANRRKWVQLVTGDLARRWLMGDDRVVEEIARVW